MEAQKSAIFGTCLSMCPKDEISMREREGLLHPLESVQTEDCLSYLKGMSVCKSPSKLMLRADVKRTVKEYSRSAAGREDMSPCNVRPPPVLRQTVDYLLNNVACLEYPVWNEIYDFVFDRLRAVRQDMVVQGMMGKDAIAILEQAVRFHAYASYRLRDLDIAEFDPVINRQHLLECLKRLLHLYQVTDGCHEHQAEFESVYLLDNLGNEEALKHYLSLPSWLRNNPLVVQSFRTSLAVLMRNYARAFRLLQSVPSPICLCVASRHLTKLRIGYLQILSHGHSCKNCQFPLTKLSDLLYCCDPHSEPPTTNYAADLCSSCHLIDWFSTQGHTDFVCFNKAMFSWPSEMKPCPPFPALDAKIHPHNLSSILIKGTTEGRIIKEEEQGGKERPLTGMREERKENVKTPRGRGRGRKGVESERKERMRKNVEKNEDVCVYQNKDIVKERDGVGDGVGRWSGDGVCGREMDGDVYENWEKRFEDSCELDVGEWKDIYNYNNEDVCINDRLSKQYEDVCVVESGQEVKNGVVIGKGDNERFKDREKIGGKRGKDLDYDLEREFSHSLRLNERGYGEKEEAGAEGIKEEESGRLREERNGKNEIREAESFVGVSGNRKKGKGRGRGRGKNL